MASASSLAFALPLLFALGALSQSIKNCGGPSDHFSNVAITVSPDPIQKGQPFSLVFEGDLDEDTTDFIFNISVAVQALAVVKVHVDGEAPLSFSPGLPKGHQKITVGPISIPSSIPGYAVLKGRVNILNGKGEPMACGDIDMNIPAAEDTTLPSESLAVGDITSCGTASDHIPDLKIDASTSTVTGTLDELVSTMEIALDVKIKVLIVSLPIKMTIPIAFTPGIPQGPFKLTAGESTVVVKPAIKVAVTGTAKSTDANGEQLCCLNIDNSDAAGVIV